jgi:hypothetical protein
VVDLLTLHQGIGAAEIVPMVRFLDYDPLAAAVLGIVGVVALALSM